MKFKAIIFDLDGTLAYTLEDIGDAMNRVIGSYGFPLHDYETYRGYIGRGLRNLVMMSLPFRQRSDAMINECFDRMIEDYRQNCLVKTVLYDGIADLITKLSVMGYKLAVLSNKTHELTQVVVNDLFKKNYFEIVQGSLPSIPNKPDPAGAFYVAEALGVPTHEIAYVGDSEVDMMTAVKAGMYAIGVPWGYRERVDLIRGGADVIVETPKELLELFL